MVLPESNKFVYLSARNIPKTKVATVAGLNTYVVLDAANVILTEKSVAAIEEQFKA